MRYLLKNALMAAASYVCYYFANVRDYSARLFLIAVWLIILTFLHGSVFDNAVYPLRDGDRKCRGGDRRRLRVTRESEEYHRPFLRGKNGPQPLRLRVPKAG